MPPVLFRIDAKACEKSSSHTQAISPYRRAPAFTLQTRKSSLSGVTLIIGQYTVSFAGVIWQLLGVIDVVFNELHYHFVRERVLLPTDDDSWTTQQQHCVDAGNHLMYIFRLLSSIFLEHEHPRVWGINNNTIDDTSARGWEGPGTRESNWPWPDPCLDPQRILSRPRLTNNIPVSNKTGAGVCVPRLAHKAVIIFGWQYWTCTEEGC